MERIGCPNTFIIQRFLTINDHIYNINSLFYVGVLLFPVLPYCCVPSCMSYIHLSVQCVSVM